MKASPHVKLCGTPDVSVVAFNAKNPAALSVYAIADGLKAAGWHVNILQAWLASSYLLVVAAAAVMVRLSHEALVAASLCVRVQKPAAIHIAVTFANARNAQQFVDDMNASIQSALAHPGMFPCSWRLCAGRLDSTRVVLLRLRRGVQGRLRCHLRLLILVP